MENPSLKLVVEKGPRKGETVECKPGSQIRIGRIIRGNNFTIKDPGISQKHLRIEFSDIEKWTVTDLDTSNGTILNGVEIPAMKGTLLKNGDIVKIGGSTSMTVLIEEKIVVNAADVPPEEIQLRGNRRRQKKAIASREQQEVPESVPDIPKKSQKSDLEMENCAETERNDVPEKRSRRNLRFRAVTKKPSESALGSAPEIEKSPQKSKLGLESCEEKENDALQENRWGKNLRSRGRPRNIKNCKEEVEKDVESVAVSEIQRIPRRANLGLESCGQSEHIASPEYRRRKPRTRVAAKKSKVSDVEAELLESVPASVSEVQKLLPKTNMGAESCRETGNNANAIAEKAVPVDEVGGGENKGIVIENLVRTDDAGGGKDLEKITLGEWFHHMEVYLPKQINSVANELIDVLRQRQQQFEEFVAQQHDGKGKLPAAS